MNCSQHDLKGYFLGELAVPERGEVEKHLEACPSCREELARLSLTKAALASLPDEEMPHRIAFVSDKIFEPRGWARFWNSAPRLGFASAAMLSAALVIFAFVRPLPVIPPSGQNTEAIEARVESEVAQRLQTVLQKTVAQASDAQSRKTAEMLADTEKRIEMGHRADLVAVQENLRDLGVLAQRYNNFRVEMASANFGRTQ